MDLIKKFLQYAVGNGLVFLVGIISTPLLTRLILPEEMGKFSMFNSVVNLIIIYGLIGLDQSFVRYFYEESETARSGLLKKITSYALGIAVAVCVVILLFEDKISHFIVGENSHLFIVCLVGYLLSSVVNKFAVLNLRMQQKAILYSVINTALKLTYLVFAVIMFRHFENSYMTLVVASTMSMVVTTLLAMAADRRSWLVKSYSKLTVTSKELFKYGFPFVFSMSLTWVFQSMDKMFIRNICGYEELGLYSGALNIVNILNTCQAMFTTFWVPVAYEKFTTLEDPKPFYIQINKIVTMVMTIITILLILAKDIIILLLGNAYREAVFIFPYLVFMPIMYTISETTVMGINFAKDTKSHIYVSVIAAICNLLGNAALVPLYGAKGAAISTGLSYVAFFSARTYFSNKLYPVKYELRKIAECVGIVCMIAIYASFHYFDLVTAIIAIMGIAAVIFLYADIWNEVVNMVLQILGGKGEKSGQSNKN